MKLIPLTGKHGTGKFAMVDDEDHEELNKYKWFFSTGSKRNSGYAERTVYLGKSDGKHRFKRIKMHREIMKTPNGLSVDHIDHNGLNDQKYNMRNCTHKQNSMNKSAKKNGSSKYLGVTWVERLKKWAVRLKIDGKIKHIALHTNEDEAALIYNEYAKKHYGEFASMNKIKKAEKISAFNCDVTN